MQLSTERIEAARQGDRAAREELGAWCLRCAFRLAFTDLGSMPNRRIVAEEIAGEASAKAIAHLDQFQPDTRFSSWLHAIVRNCIRDHFRRADRGLPLSIYRRWVHDFLTSYGPELEDLIRRKVGADASEPHPILLERLADDMRQRTYRQFMRLVYDGPAQDVLEIVQRRLQAFVCLDWLPFYDQDAAGEWIETNLPGEDETEAQVLEHEFVQQVNERLARLEPFCRRLIRWYFLDRIRVPEIARLEQLNERTAYRRLDHCAAHFRKLLLHGGYFAEYAAQHGASPLGRRV